MKLNRKYRCEFNARRILERLTRTERWEYELHSMAFCRYWSGNHIEGKRHSSKNILEKRNRNKRRLKKHKPNETKTNYKIIISLKNWGFGVCARVYVCVCVCVKWKISFGYKCNKFMCIEYNTTRNSKKNKKMFLVKCVNRKTIFAFCIQK